MVGCAARCVAQGLQPRLTYVPLPGDSAPQGDLDTPKAPGSHIPSRVSAENGTGLHTLPSDSSPPSLPGALHRVPLPAPWATPAGDSLSPGMSSSLGGTLGTAVSALGTPLPVSVLPLLGGPEGVVRVKQDKLLWVRRPSGRGALERRRRRWPRARVLSRCPWAGTAEDSEGRDFVHAGFGNNGPKTKGRKGRKVKWQMWDQY